MTGSDIVRRGTAGVPPAGQADGRDVQPRLLVLLLPVQGDALPGQPLPHGRRAAGAVRPPAHRGAPGAARQHRLAGRRAHPDGRGLLPAGHGVRGEVPAAGDDGRVHDPDQRHAHRRRAGRVLQGARLPGRDQHRRPAVHARRLPGGPGRRAHLRPRAPRPGAAPRARRGGQHADHAPPGQRGPPRRGVPVPARRVRLALHAVHPDHRAAARPADRRPARGAGAGPGPGPARRRGPPGATARSTARRAASSRTAP